jgi:hypothetical protein
MVFGDEDGGGKLRELRTYRAKTIAPQNRRTYRTRTHRTRSKGGKSKGKDRDRDKDRDKDRDRDRSVCFPNYLTTNIDE